MSLETIVQNMVTAKEPEANIAQVIKHYNQINKSPLKQVEETEVVEEEVLDCPEGYSPDPNDPSKCVPNSDTKVLQMGLTEPAQLSTTGITEIEQVETPQTSTTQNTLPINEAEIEEKEKVEFDPTIQKTVDKISENITVPVKIDDKQENKIYEDSWGEVVKTDDWFPNFHKTTIQENLPEIKKRRQQLANEFNIQNFQNKAVEEIYSENKDLIENKSKAIVDELGNTKDAQVKFDEWYQNFMQSKLSGVDYYQNAVNNYYNEFNKFQQDFINNKALESPEYQERIKQYQTLIGNKVNSQKAKNLEKLREINTGIMAKYANVPEFMVPKAAAVGEFVLNTSAGVVDFVEKYGYAPLAAMIKSGSMPGFAGVPGMQGMASPEYYEELDKIARENNIDLTEVYDVAKSLGSLKTKYYDDDTGKELDVVDLIAKGEYTKAANLAVNEAVGSAPSLALSVAFPIAGSVLLGAGTAGQGFEEDLINRPDEILPNIYSANLLKGLAETGTEFAGAKLFRYINKLNKAGTNKEVIQNFIKPYLATMNATLQGGGSEFSTEFMTQVAQELTDAGVYGDEKEFMGVLKRSVNAGLIGSLLGGKASGVTTLSQVMPTGDNKKRVFNYIAPKQYKLDMDKINHNIVLAKEALKTAPDFKKKRLQNKLDVLNQQKENRENNLEQAFDNLSESELNLYGKNLDIIEESLVEIGNDNYTNDQQKIAQNNLQNATLENQSTVTPEIFDAGVEQSIGKALKRSEKIARDTGALKGINEKDLSVETVTSDVAKDKYNMDEESAIFVEEKGKGKIIINSEIASASKAGGAVVPHELLHYILSKNLNTGDTAIQPLVDSFKEYVGKVSPDVMKRIESRIENHYTEKDAQGNPIIGKLLPGANQEYFTIFSDIVGSEKIPVNESVSSKIKTSVNNWLQNLGIKNAKLDTGKQVFDFIKNFNKNINKKGKFTDLGIKIESDIVEKAPVDSSTKVESVSDLDGLLTKYDGNVTSMVQDTYLTKPGGGDAIGNIQESILAKEIAPITESITKKLFDPIAKDATKIIDENRDVARAKYKQELISSAAEIMSKYDPSRGSLDKYVSTTLNQRANRLAKQLGVESIPEKGGLGIKQDVTQAKTIAVEDKGADAIIKKPLLKSLPLTKDTKDKIGNYIEVGLQKAANELSTELKPGKAFTNAGIKTINNALDSTIKLKAGPEIKEAVLKLSKNQNNFDKYIKKNWEDVFNSYLDNINLNKLNNPKSLPTKELLQNYKDNGFTQEDVLNYFNDPSIRSNTRSDRKNKALFNAIIRNISEDAKIDFWENNKKAKQEFIKNFGIASKSDIDPQIQEYFKNNENAPQILKHTGQGALESLLGKKFIKAGAMAVYNDKGVVDIKASKKYIDKFIPEFESLLSQLPLIGNASRSKNGILKIGTIYRPSPKKLFGSMGSSTFRATNPDVQPIYNELNNYFNKKRAESIGRLSKANLPKFIKGSPAENYNPTKFTFKGIAKNFKEFDNLRKNGKLEKINLTNLDMWKQNSQALYDAITNNPDLIPAAAWLLNNDSYGEAYSWFRHGAEIIGMSFNTKPGITWEHAMQANNAATFFIESAMAGVPFNIVHDGIQKNYKVIGLNKNDDPGKHFKDNMAMPGETWNVYTDSWTNRYVNPLVAVDLSTIGTGDGNTLADLYPTNKVVAASKSDLDQSFNTMLEKSKGIKAEAQYSEARAIKLGEKKGFQAFVPYSAEDYLGLVYPTLGKGKQGDKDLQWYKDNIMDPYNNGIQEFEVAKQGSITAWNEIKKKIKNTPANLKKEAVRGFNNEDAIRVYLWGKQDISPDNLAKKDISEITKYVNSKPELKKFANEIQMLNPAGYPAPNNNWLVGTITTDLVNHVNTVARSEFLQPWQEAVDAVYNKTNKNKLRAAFGNNYVEALEDVLYRMKTGRNRPAGTNRITNTWLNWLNDSVGTVMFLNQRSALLQTISSINYLNWTDNNPAQAAKAFANQKQFWNDFTYLFNSDFLKQRRSGLKTDVNADEIAQSAATSPNKARAAASWLLKKGFLPTQMADSFAISIGGASFYRNRLNKYKKDGLNQNEAEEKAFLDFRNNTTESQQSADPSRISMQQASPLGRVILAFANTPIQYTRLTKRAIQDLRNGRGDWKTNVSKTMYYGAVQNIIFTGLQQALFGMLFDDDEEIGEKEAQFKQDRKEGSILKLINSSADTILRGSGVGGAFIAMLKNLALEAKRQSEKSRPDYERVADKLFSFSPVIDSKFRKLQSAGRTFTYKQELKKIQERGVAVDNPALMAAAQTLSAFANIPLDRAIKKINNLKTMTEEETKLWQQIALFMGYGEWELGIQARKVDEERAKVKKEKAEEKKFKTLQKNIDKGTKKKSPVKALQHGVLGRANRDGTIEVAPGLSPKKRAEVVRHEKLHQKEIKSGKLDYDDNFIYYGKKKFERKNGRIAHGGKWKQEGDHSLPWEKFAHKHD